MPSEIGKWYDGVLGSKSRKPKSRKPKSRKNPSKKRRAKTAFSDATTSFIVGKTHYRVGRSRKTNGDWRLHERWKDKHGAIHWDPVWGAPKVSGDTTANLIRSGIASAEAYERKMIGLEKEYDEAIASRERPNPAHCIDLHKYPTDIRKLTAAKRRMLVAELSKEPVAWLKRKRASLPSLKTEKVQKLADSVMAEAIKAAEARTRRNPHRHPHHHDAAASRAYAEYGIRHAAGEIAEDGYSEGWHGKHADVERVERLSWWARSNTRSNPLPTFRGGEPEPVMRQVISAGYEIPLSTFLFLKTHAQFVTPHLLIKDSRHWQDPVEADAVRLTFSMSAVGLTSEMKQLGIVRFGQSGWQYVAVKRGETPRPPPVRRKRRSAQAVRDSKGFDERMKDPAIRARNAFVARFGRAISRWVKTDESYEILGPDGGTWSAGGCWLLARAIQLVIEAKSPSMRPRLVALIGNGAVQHVVVCVGDVCIDADGPGILGDIVDEFVERESVRIDSTEPFDEARQEDARQRGMVCPARSITKIASVLRDQFGFLLT